MVTGSFESEPQERAIIFTVVGRPAPKGSRIYGRRKDGSSFSRPASRYEHDWTVSVADTCLAVHPRVDPPYRIDMAFRIQAPARSKHGYPTRADLDKLARATIDGLVSGRLLIDDRHVTEIHASVAYGAPVGATIEVSTASAPRAVAA